MIVERTCSRSRVVEASTGVSISSTFTFSNSTSSFSKDDVTDVCDGSQTNESGWSWFCRQCAAQRSA